MSRARGILSCISVARGSDAYTLVRLPIGLLTFLVTVAGTCCGDRSLEREMYDMVAVLVAHTSENSSVFSSTRTYFCTGRTVTVSSSPCYSYDRTEEAAWPEHGLHLLQY